MQLATVILMVELLQRTHAEIGVQQENHSFSTYSSSSSQDLSSNSVELISSTAQQEKGSNNGDTDAPSESESESAPPPPLSFSSSSHENSIFSVSSSDVHTNPLALDSQRLPDLHRMGKFFLKRKWMASTFDASVVLHFCAAMISCVYFFLSARCMAVMFMMIFVDNIFRKTISTPIFLFHSLPGFIFLIHFAGTILPVQKRTVIFLA
jgi:hypothetical protein